MRKLLLVTLGLLFGAALPLWAAPDPVIRESVAVCDPGAPTQCAKPSGGAIPVTGTFSASLAGFRPTAFGTPVSASNVSSTQSLPAGGQVVATNISSTVGVYCALGATATTSSQFIPPSSWFGFAISGDTQISCITASSTATVNTAGGTGLPTGANGGGGGGGGGGAATIADGADVAEGATSDAAATQGSTGSVSAKLRTVTSQLNTLATNTTSIATAANQTTGNTSLAAIATSVAGATPAGTNLIGKVGIDQTTPGTTNGVQVNAALPAGTNIIGNVRIDQTTPGTTNGVQVNAGTAAIGYVGGFNANLSNAPTVQNAAYSASNAIGGLQTVAAFRNTTQPSGILNYVQVISTGGSTQGLTIYGFTKTPSATCTDKVAFAASAADYANAIPGFPVVLTPAVTQGTTASRASQSIVVSVKNTDSSPTANLYFCAVVNGSVTPASTTDLTFGYSIAQD